MRTGFFAAIAAASLALPTVANAASGDPTVRVSYYDLDLATPGGLTTLRERVRDAVRLACAQTIAESPLNSVSEEYCLGESQRVANRDIERARKRWGATATLSAK